MKTLNLDVDTPPSSKDVFENLNTLFINYGKEFDVKYKGVKVPFVVKRSLNTPKKPVYKLSINYTKTHTMKYSTLIMTIKHSGNDEAIIAHIDFVHRNEEHGLTGTYIVNLATDLLKYIGVSKVTLQDAAKTQDAKTKCSLYLTPYLLLKKSVTFYGKWGFKPTANYQGNTSYENDKERVKRLCKLVARLQRVKVRDILMHLATLYKALKSSKETDTIVSYDVAKNHTTGVEEIRYYDDDWDKEGVSAFLDEIALMTKHLMNFAKSTIEEMMQTCSCIEFKALIGFFETSHIVMINKKKYVNKYISLYAEFEHILDGSIYILDLTKKPSTTCK